VIEVIFTSMKMSDMANTDLEKYAKALDKQAFPVTISSGVSDACSLAPS
jgi:hypothetical protein